MGTTRKKRSEPQTAAPPEEEGASSEGREQGENEEENKTTSSPKPTRPTPKAPDEERENNDDDDDEPPHRFECTHYTEVMDSLVDGVSGSKMGLHSNPMDFMFIGSDRSGVRRDWAFLQDMRLIDVAGTRTVFHDRLFAEKLDAWRDYVRDQWSDGQSDQKNHRRALADKQSAENTFDVHEMLAALESVAADGGRVEEHKMHTSRRQKKSPARGDDSPKDLSEVSIEDPTHIHNWPDAVLLVCNSLFLLGMRFFADRMGIGNFTLLGREMRELMIYEFVTIHPENALERTLYHIQQTYKVWQAHYQHLCRVTDTVAGPGSPLKRRLVSKLLTQLWTRAATPDRYYPHLQSLLENRWARNARDGRSMPEDVRNETTRARRCLERFVRECVQLPLQAAYDALGVSQESARRMLRVCALWCGRLPAERAEVDPSMNGSSAVASIRGPENHRRSRESGDAWAAFLDGAEIVHELLQFPPHWRENPSTEVRLCLDCLFFDPAVLDRWDLDTRTESGSPEDVRFAWALYECALLWPFGAAETSVEIVESLIRPALQLARKHSAAGYLWPLAAYCRVCSEHARANKAVSPALRDHALRLTQTIVSAFDLGVAGEEQVAAYLECLHELCSLWLEPITDGAAGEGAPAEGASAEGADETRGANHDLLRRVLLVTETAKHGVQQPLALFTWTAQVTRFREMVRPWAEHYGVAELLGSRRWSMDAKGLERALGAEEASGEILQEVQRNVRQLMAVPGEIDPWVRLHSAHEKSGRGKWPVGSVTVSPTEEDWSFGMHLDPEGGIAALFRQVTSSSALGQRISDLIDDEMQITELTGFRAAGFSYEWEPCADLDQAAEIPTMVATPEVRDIAIRHLFESRGRLFAVGPVLERALSHAEAQRITLSGELAPVLESDICAAFPIAMHAVIGYVFMDERPRARAVNIRDAAASVWYRSHIGLLGCAMMGGWTLFRENFGRDSEGWDKMVRECSPTHTRLLLADSERVLNALGQLVREAEARGAFEGELWYAAGMLVGLLINPMLDPESVHSSPYPGKLEALVSRMLRRATGPSEERQQEALRDVWSSYEHYRKVTVRLDEEIDWRHLRYAEALFQARAVRRFDQELWMDPHATGGTQGLPAGGTVVSMARRYRECDEDVARVWHPDCFGLTDTDYISDSHLHWKRYVAPLLVKRRGVDPERIGGEEADYDPFYAPWRASCEDEDPLAAGWTVAILRRMISMLTDRDSSDFYHEQRVKCAKMILETFQQPEVAATWYSSMRAVVQHALCVVGNQFALLKPPHRHELLLPWAQAVYEWYRTARQESDAIHTEAMNETRDGVPGKNTAFGRALEVLHQLTIDIQVVVQRVRRELRIEESAEIFTVLEPVRAYGLDDVAAPAFVGGASHYDDDDDPDIPGVPEDSAAPDIYRSMAHRSGVSEHEAIALLHAGVEETVAVVNHNDPANRQSGHVGNMDNVLEWLTVISRTRDRDRKLVRIDHKGRTDHNKESFDQAAAAYVFRIYEGGWQCFDTDDDNVMGVQRVAACVDRAILAFSLCMARSLREDRPAMRNVATPLRPEILLLREWLDRAAEAMSFSRASYLVAHLIQVERFYRECRLIAKEAQEIGIPDTGKVRALFSEACRIATDWALGEEPRERPPTREEFPRLGWLWATNANVGGKPAAGMRWYRKMKEHPTYTGEYKGAKSSIPALSHTLIEFLEATGPCHGGWVRSVGKVALYGVDLAQDTRDLSRLVSLVGFSSFKRVISVLHKDPLTLRDFASVGSWAGLCLLRGGTPAPSVFDAPWKSPRKLRVPVRMLTVALSWLRWNLQGNSDTTLARHWNELITVLALETRQTPSGLLKTLYKGELWANIGPRTMWVAADNEEEEGEEEQRANRSTDHRPRYKRRAREQLSRTKDTGAGAMDVDHVMPPTELVDGHKTALMADLRRLRRSDFWTKSPLHLSPWMQGGTWGPSAEDQERSEAEEELRRKSVFAPQIDHTQMQERVGATMVALACAHWAKVALPGKDETNMERRGHAANWEVAYTWYGWCERSFLRKVVDWSSDDFVASYGAYLNFALGSLESASKEVSDWRVRHETSAQMLCRQLVDTSPEVEGFVDVYERAVEDATLKYPSDYDPRADTEKLISWHEGPAQGANGGYTVLRFPRLLRSLLRYARLRGMDDRVEGESAWRDTFESTGVVALLLEMHHETMSRAGKWTRLQRQIAEEYWSEASDLLSFSVDPNHQERRRSPPEDHENSFQEEDNVFEFHDMAKALAEVIAEAGNTGKRRN